MVGDTCAHGRPAGVRVPLARRHPQLCRNALDHAVRIGVTLRASCRQRSQHAAVALPLLVRLRPLDR
eukprot:875788-Prymnesium_polylepis.1